MLPRNFEDKYHSRPHPLLMKCEARAISRDPVLMRAIELRLYARLVSSAWWRRRLDHAVLFKSFISVTHCPSQRNWWILQIYGIPMPEQVGIFFRGFARLMRVSHCSSGSSLVRDRDDVTHRSCANFTVGYHIAFYGANLRHQLIFLTSPAAKWIPDRPTIQIRAENSLGKGT